MIIALSIMTTGFFLMSLMYAKKCSDEKKNEKYQIVRETMKDACEEAEGLSLGGLEKKIYVLKITKATCSSNKLKYDENLWASEIDTYIERINKFNKKINN